MTSVLSCLLACALALPGGWALTPVPAQWAQAQGQGRWGPVPDATVDRVVFRIGQANAYCGWLGAEWVADCLADQYDQIARGLPRTAEWNPVRAVMAQAAGQMAEVARAAALPGVRPARPDEAGKPTQVGAGRALQRTQPRALPAAARLLDETETRLLRSVGGSDQRAAAFRRVAAAVGAGRVLLRST